MSNNNKGHGHFIAIAIFVIILILSMITGTKDNDYKRAGKSFGTWSNQSPQTWTNTQRKYFNDFWEWNDKN